MGEAVIFKAWDDMNMEVENELPRWTVIIDADVDAVRSDSLFHFGCEEVSRSHYPSKFLRGNLVHVLIMLFRDDKRMPSVDGVDIEERESILILVNILRRDFPGDDFTEETLCIRGHTNIV